MKRIYLVTDDRVLGVPDRQTQFLVSATSPHQARTFVARKSLHVAIAKPREIVDLMREKIEVEEANDE